MTSSLLIEHQNLFARKKHKDQEIVQVNMIETLK